MSKISIYPNPLAAARLHRVASKLARKTINEKKQ